MSLLFSFSSLYGQEKKNIIIYGINFPPLSAPELSGYGLLPQAVSESLKEKITILSINFYQWLD